MKLHKLNPFYVKPQDRNILFWHGENPVENNAMRIALWRVRMMMIHGRLEA